LETGLWIGLQSQTKYSENLEFGKLKAGFFAIILFGFLVDKAAYGGLFYSIHACLAKLVKYGFMKW